MTVRPLVIVNDYGYVNGGAAQVALGDAIALARAGHNITFFCAIGPVAPELTAAGVHVICLEQHAIAQDPDRLRAARQGIWNGKAARTLDGLLAAYARPPIVHIHGWSKALSSSVCATALARRAPVVVSLHDYFAACPNGGFYQYPQQRICELHAMSAACIACNCDSRNYVQKLYRVARQTVQRCAGHLPRGVKHFVCHSRLVYNVMMPYVPQDAYIHAVPIAVNVDYAPPVSVAQNDDFVMVGRLSPEKGPLLFARAATCMGIRPVFIGDGREREIIMAAAPDAEVTGWQSSTGVAARMERARALVFPSLWYETFGLTVAEALARGIPVIVADRSAASELVEDGLTGVLFSTGDSSSLASCLEILKNAPRASAMGQRAHERYWQTPLSADRHVAAMLAVYEGLQA